MRFSGLLDPPHNANTGVIDLQAIAEAVPKAPQPVATQFFADHGRKEEFQALYGHLKLGPIEWQLIAFTAASLGEVGLNPQYESWFKNVERRADNLSKQGWACIDKRPAVVEHWRQFRTWRTRRWLFPVFC
jgi:hypothetical protein